MNITIPHIRKKTYSRNDDSIQFPLQTHTLNIFQEASTLIEGQNSDTTRQKIPTKFSSNKSKQLCWNLTKHQDEEIPSHWNS